MNCTAEERERIITAVIERAQQACRYVLKHQTFEGESTDYTMGFEIACEVCERAISAHVRRHIDQDVGDEFKLEP